VAAGAPLVAWDADAVEAGGRSSVSPVIALDALPEAIGDTVTTGQVEAGAKLFVWQ
jgi:sugar PTS system EIIA component